MSTEYEAREEARLRRFAGATTTSPSKAYRAGWDDALAWQATQPVTVTAEQVEGVRRAIFSTTGYINSNYYPSDQQNVTRIANAVLTAAGVAFTEKEET